MLTLTKRAPENGEILKARPEPGKQYDKYAVAGERCGDVLGHLSKGRSARFAKTVSHFLRASNENCCRFELTSKRVFMRWKKTSFFWRSKIC